MTTPPDDFENDPTGMRDLLRSLPDPGPMPQDVTDRITAALAEERTGRAGDDHSNVTPMTRTGRDAKPAGRRWMQAVGGLVAAAAVAAVAVVGVNSLQDDKAPVTSLPSGTHHSASTDELASRVQIESTGTSYTGASFNNQAASMATGSNSSRIPAKELLAQFGALTKPRAIIGCVRSVGGALLDNPSSIKVDLATYDGKPALIVVVSKGSKHTAFAVSSSCSKGDKPYAEPRSV